MVRLKDQSECFAHSQFSSKHSINCSWALPLATWWHLLALDSVKGEKPLSAFLSEEIAGR